MIVKNKLFYWVFIIFLSSLFLYNAVSFLNTHGIKSLVAMGMQATLLLCLLCKHKYAKPFLKIWLIVFVMASSIIQMLIQLIVDFYPDKVLEDAFVGNMIYFAIGLFFLTWIDKALKIPRHTAHEVVKTKEGYQQRNL